VSKIFVAITCGISLLQNLLNSDVFKDYLRRKFNINEELCPSHIIRNNVLLDSIYRDFMVNEDFAKMIMGLLREDPERCCAELNSLIKLLRTLDDFEICRVYLYSSNTRSCSVCSQMICKFIVDYLREFLGKKGNVEVKGILTIPDILSGRYSEALQKLAEGFLREAYRHVKKGYDLYTIITGGFKIEIAYITVLSFLVRSKIVYCPGPDSDIVILPPVPIDLDQNILRICERIAKGEAIDRDVVDVLKRYGLVCQKNGKIVLEKWVSKLLEARRWSSTY